MLTEIGADILAFKSLADFRRALRTVVRKYWNGLSSNADFTFEFLNAIDRAFNRAFNIGLAECGQARNNETDTADLQELINNQFAHISGLAERIVKKEDGGKLLDNYALIEPWVARFEEARQLGAIQSCGDELREWVVGIAEHCESCLKLNGIVKPLSYWKEQGILPRVANASYLICKGFKCQCSLKKTKKPMTKGALPSLP